MDPPDRPGGLSPAVAGAVSASRSDATRRAYSEQWRQFVAWASDAGGTGGRRRIPHGPGGAGHRGIHRKGHHQRFGRGAASCAAGRAFVMVLSCSSSSW